MSKSYIPVYAGIFFEDSEMRTLRAWFRHETGLDLLGEFPKDPHFTSAFKPSVEEVQAMPLGRKAHLSVIGWVADEKAQAVLIRGFPSDRPHPHITLSVAPGVSPAYSKDLLASVEVTPARGPSVEGTIGYYDGEVCYEYTPPPPPKPKPKDSATGKLLYNLQVGQPLLLSDENNDVWLIQVYKDYVTHHRDPTSGYDEEVLGRQTYDEFRTLVLNEGLRLRRPRVGTY